MSQERVLAVLNATPPSLCLCQDDLVLLDQSDLPRDTPKKHLRVVSSSPVQEMAFQLAQFVGAN